MMEHIGTRVELLLLQQKHEGEGEGEGGPKKTRAHCRLEVHSSSIGENWFYPKRRVEALSSFFLDGLTVTMWRSKATGTLFLLV